MNSVTLIVLVIAQQGGDPSTAALERTARRALGPDAVLEVVQVPTDPPDPQSEERAAQADGLVELSWSSDGTKAHLHCYLRRDARWLDRELSFGSRTASYEREANERGRLLGFAIATMFADEALELPAPSATTATTAKARDAAGSAAADSRPLSPRLDEKPPALAAPTAEGSSAAAQQRDVAPRASSSEVVSSLELSGIAASGLEGDGGGIGANAAVRALLTERLGLRFFLAGRSGSIPRAQASTLTGMAGAGLALAFLPRASRLELGLRLDTFASYFTATHLSSDDPAPDTRGRWLPGGSLVLESGWRLTPRTGLLAAGGLEAVGGRTDVYTHGERVAQVSPWRMVAEFGFKSRF